MAERRPTPAELAAELLDPVVAVLVTEGGDWVRFIRQAEHDRMRAVAKTLLTDGLPEA